MDDSLVIQCRRCFEHKLRTEFYDARYTKDNGEKSAYSYCIECARKDSLDYYHTHGNKKSRERAWADQGIKFTVEEYDELLTAQGGGCAICFVATNKSGRRLAVDHCHETGRVRGILCTNCNVTLGRMNDDPDLLRRAAEYLEAHTMKVIV